MHENPISKLPLLTNVQLNTSGLQPPLQSLLVPHLKAKCAYPENIKTKMNT